MLNKLKCMVCVSIMVFLAAICVGIPANPDEDPHVMIWYKLDETEGGTAHDGSMYGRDAVVDGPGNLGVWNPDDGQFGGSLIFNDNTDIEVPTDALSTISTGITVSVWLKDASRPGSNNWVFGTGSGSVRVTAAVVASNGSVLWRAGNSSNDQLSWDLDGVDHTTLNGWHHWVFVKDEVSGTISIYLDGSLAASKSGVDNTLVNVPGSQLRFGTGAGHANDFIGMMDDIRVYDLALTAGEVQLLYTGVFDVAVDPDPADKAEDIPRDSVILSWMPGAFADKHDIYFGTNFNDVDNATRGDPVFQGTQSQNAYALDRLEFGQTYYWRIDEVNDLESSSPSKGDLWSFTTEPVGYPIENLTATASSVGQADVGPENTINGSGLDDDGLHSTEPTDMWLSGSEPLGAWIQYEFNGVYKLHEMWVWNSNQLFEAMFLGFGVRDVTVEYSTDGVDWTALADVSEFTQAPGADGYAHNTTVDFGGAVAKYVRLTAASNWAGLPSAYGLSEVRFFYIPILAREPNPDSGTTDVSIGTIDETIDVNLGFRAGREAARHDVYLSSDEQAVIDGNAPVTTVTETSYGPLSLDLGTTYYWRLDEVNEAQTPTTWQGDIWDFRTQEYFVVEDFEDYNDYPPDEIWSTWIDGYGVPTNGSTAGYPAPDFLAGEHYVETAIVHGGKQAMPFFYDNTGTAAYSEAERTFNVPQDWTKAGIQTLVLHFLGDPNNAVEQMYVKLNGSKVVYDGDAADITQPWWHQWNLDLASFGVDIQNLTKLSFGFGDQTSTTLGGSGKVLFDNVRLYRSVPGPPVGIWIEAEAADSITSPMEIYDDHRASGGKYISTDESVGNSSDAPTAPAGTASYIFAVEGGTYKISGRINFPDGSNSFWVRIQGAAIPIETELDPTGWVEWNGLPDTGSWYWHDVFSDDDNENATVLFTLSAGTHTLEIGYREDGAMLDAIVISKID